MDVIEFLTKRHNPGLPNGAIRPIGKNRVSLLSKAINNQDVNRGKMAIECVITTQEEDRDNDVIITDGIDLRSHIVNPSVMYNHGQPFDKPIAKAQDPAGNYTVVREPNALRAVAYFSQSLPEAEQLFALAEEGILKGWSIQAVPVETEFRDVINPSKGYAALLVKQCELIEFSLTPLPNNRGALTERILKGPVCNRPLPQTILKSLQPYLLTMPKVVPVSMEKSKMAVQKGDYAPLEDPNQRKPGETDDVSGKDPTPKNPGDDPNQPDQDYKEREPAQRNPGETDDVSGDRNKSVDAKPDASPPGEENQAGDKDPTDDYPPGAKVMAGLHDRAMEMSAFISDSYKNQENPKVRDYLDAKTESILEDVASLKEFWKAEYSDLPDLPGDESDDTDSDSENQEDKKKKKKKSFAHLSYRKAILKSAGKDTAKDKIIEEQKAMLERSEKVIKRLLNEVAAVKKEFALAKRGR